MPSKTTKIFKATGWEGPSKKKRKCPWEVEVEHTYDDPIIIGENHSDYVFTLKGFWETIKLAEKTAFEFFSNNASDLISLGYELEVLDNKTGKTTRYKCVKVE